MAERTWEGLMAWWAQQQDPFHKAKWRHLNREAERMRVEAEQRAREFPNRGLRVPVLTPAVFVKSVTSDPWYWEWPRWVGEHETVRAPLLCEAWRACRAV